MMAITDLFVLSLLFLYATFEIPFLLNNKYVQAPAAVSNSEEWTFISSEYFNSLAKIDLKNVYSIPGFNTTA